MRKLWVLWAISILTAAGCNTDGGPLRRMEVWKQHTFFSPSQPQFYAPAADCDVDSAWQPLQDDGPVETSIASPEEIDGVLEQP